jgi:Ca-activated chloride channel homolog
VTLEAPDTVPAGTDYSVHWKGAPVAGDAVFAGSTFHVAWTGPNGPKDYVTLVKPDAEAGDYGDYVYTRDGKELAFTAPSDPGAYELRYQSDRTEIGVLGRRPLTVR